MKGCTAPNVCDRRIESCSSRSKIAKYYAKLRKPRSERVLLERMKGKKKKGRRYKYEPVDVPTPKPPRVLHKSKVGFKTKKKPKMGIPSKDRMKRFMHK
jgi:hypothetical protein